MGNAPSDMTTPGQWRAALALLGVTLGGSLLLALLLAGGLADPPRAGALAWHDDQIAAWGAAPAPAPGLTALRAPHDLPAPPFTLEVSAHNSGDPLSAWGIWIGDAVTILLRREGYISVRPLAPDWGQFMHIQPVTNHVYLHVLADDSATLRINGEIAWRGSFTPAAAWGVLALGDARLRWQMAEVFGITPKSP